MKNKTSKPRASRREPQRGSVIPAQGCGAQRSRAATLGKPSPAPSNPEGVVSPGYATCPDCGGNYMIGKPHAMFCEARTCTQCGTSYPDVIEETEPGVRLCERCVCNEEDP